MARPSFVDEWANYEEKPKVAPQKSTTQKTTKSSGRPSFVDEWKDKDIKQAPSYKGETTTSDSSVAFPLKEEDSIDFPTYEAKKVEKKPTLLQKAGNLIKDNSKSILNAFMPQSYKALSAANKYLTEDQKNQIAAGATKVVGATANAVKKITAVTPEQEARNFKMRQVMYGKDNYVTPTGEISNPLLDRFKEATTDEEREKVVKEDTASIPIFKAMNSNTGKVITGWLSKTTENVPLKAYARLESIGSKTYAEALADTEADWSNPENPYYQRILYQVQNSGVQSGIGALLAMGASALARDPRAGQAVAGAYFGAISTEAERAKYEGGNIDSFAGIQNIGIDTIGDSLISGAAEGVLKSVIKEGGENALKSIAKGFLIEGTTEPTQTLLKYANDYRYADEEQQNAIVEEVKNYVRSGAMLEEFLVAGISGAAITGLANAGGQAVNFISSRNGDPVEKEVVEKIENEIKDEVIDAIEESNPDKVEEIVKKVAKKNDITTEGVVEIIKNITTERLLDESPETNNDIEQRDALKEDIKVAIQSGKRLSSISRAIQMKYPVSDTFAQALVSEALSEVQTGELLSQNNNELDVQPLEENTDLIPEATKEVKKVEGVQEKTPKPADLSPEVAKEIVKKPKQKTYEPTDNTIQKRKEIDTKPRAVSKGVSTSKDTADKTGKTSDKSSKTKLPDGKSDSTGTTDNSKPNGNGSVKDDIEIQGTDMKQSEITNVVKSHIRTLEENFDLEGLDYSIKDIKIVGSRTVGLGKNKSDLDVLIEYSGDAREDDMFNALNRKKFKINGITIDINPIREQETGTMNDVYKDPQEFYKDKLNPVPKGQSLSEIAKGYDTFEKFLKEGVKNKLFHRTDAVFDEFDTSLDPDEMGSWFFTDKAMADEYANEFPILMVRYAESLNVISEDEMSALEDTDEYLNNNKGVEQFLTDKGYIGLGFDDNSAVQIFNPNENLLTEEQVRKIWLDSQKSKAKKVDPQKPKEKKVKKEINNDYISELVSTITTIDPTTSEVTINDSAENIEETIEIIKQYKTGGTTKEGRGILDEYYTDKKIVDAVFSFLDISEDATVLEPSVGIGNFIPSDVKQVDAYEINPITAGIAKILNKDSSVNVFNKSFETNFIDERGNKKEYSQKYDLVVGNPPYGEHRGLYKGLGEEESIAKYEDYFTKRGLDVVKEGGKVAFVIPSSFLKTQSSKSKEAISRLGYIEVAFRLPENAFEGTSIGTDIVIFTRKTSESISIRSERIESMSGDSYFEKNSDNVLGTILERKSRFGKMETYVSGDIDDALSKINELGINKLAIGIANKIGIEATDENIENIKEVIDDSSTNDVEEIIKENEEENKKAAEKEKALDESRNKKLKEKIKKQVDNSSSETFNVLDFQDRTFTENEIEHWENRNQDGSFKEGFNVDKNISSYYRGRWYPDFTYTNGNIYEKLNTLEEDKEFMSEETYNRQKQLLESVKPEIIPLERIRINANASFLKDYKIVPNDEKSSLRNDFIEFVNSMPSKALGGMTRWNIREYVDGQAVRGGSKEENARIRKYRGVVANELLEKYFEELKRERPDVAADIEKEYNARYNATHTGNYEEVPINLTVNNSLNGAPYKLTKVQIAGIARLVEKGVGILAHDVGFGKTLTTILATYYNMKNGNTKRPLFVVPKATYTQWVKTISEVVPNAKINSFYNLSAEYKGDLGTIQVNDGEFSIVTEEGFKAISFSDAVYNRFAAQYAYVTDDLTAAKSSREIEKDQEKEKEMGGKMKKGTKEIFFEELGFDHLVIDEVHNANNIVTKIKMPKEKATEFRSISRPSKPSIYGVKAWLASQYIQAANKGKNVYLASATPFTNSPMQYFSILSLVANDSMADMGIDNVNDFLNQFMDIEVRLEYKPNGTFSERQVIRNFKNFNLLRKLLDEYIDFKSGEDNPDLIRPDKQQRVNYFSRSTDYTTNEKYIQENYSGSRDVLKLIGQLRALSISSSLLSENNPDIKDYKTIVENSPKLLAIATNIGNNQKKNKAKGRVATEIVYSPFGIEIFPILKQYLMKEMGMKENEIAIITGDTKSEKRTQIQNDFNGVDENGEQKETPLRVLMGTDTIGTGLNLQKRTSDIHFLGLPYNFTDLMQVEGRAWRQGNIWRNVRMNHYLMENSYDALHFQILTSKQRRYELAIKNNEDTVDVSDVDVEKHLSDLITDPVLIADLKINEQRKEIEEVLRLKNAELSVSQKRIEKLSNIELEIERLKKGLADAELRIKDPETTEYLLKWYEEKVVDYAKEIAKAEQEYEVQKEFYVNGGIDVAELEKKIEPLKEEINVLEQKKFVLNNPETKRLFVEEAQANLKEIIPFDVKDVEEMISRYSAEEDNIYVVENRGKKQVQEVEQTAEEIIESPKAAPIKKAKARAGVIGTVNQELAIIQDKSITVKEKLEKLLEKKQEGKDFKDIGDRVSGSKKERATIKTIYKYGGLEMFNEVVNSLGWQSILETVDKGEILSDLDTSKIIKDQYDMKVPYDAAVGKNDLIQKIYRIPKLDGIRSGKYSTTATLYKFYGEENKNTSGISDNPIQFAKVYPNFLKQFVSKLLEAKTEEDLEDISGYFILTDALGNIVSRDSENKMYQLDREAIFPKAMRRVIYDIIRNLKTNEFKPEDYEGKLEGVQPKKRKVEVDTSHGNFEAIEQYDVDDKVVKKERVKAETLSNEFGFKSVQLGNYMDDASAYEHIQQTIGAMETMQRILKVDFAKFVSDKELSIAYGARGGGKALAHYEPSKNIINLTKRRGDGSFGHEFMHFIDFTWRSAAGKKLSSLFTPSQARYYTTDAIPRNLMRTIVYGGYQVDRTYKPNKQTPEELGVNNKKVIEEILEEGFEKASVSGNYMFKPQLVANLFGKEFTKKETVYKSDFVEETKKAASGAYWVKNEELLARAFQAYVYDKMIELDDVNTYLTRPVLEGGVYPRGEQRIEINKRFDDLFNEMRAKYPKFSQEDQNRIDEIKAEVKKLDQERDELLNQITEDNREEVREKMFAKSDLISKLRREGMMITGDVSFKLQSEGKGIVETSEKTVTGEFLRDISERFNIGFNYEFFDKILGQSGEDAWGVTRRNAIGLDVSAPFSTEHHEIIHLTLRNMDKIEALKGVDKDDILIEMTNRMNLPVEMYTTREVEEGLASLFEKYYNEKEVVTFKSGSKIKQFFDFIKEQILKFLKAIKLTRNGVIEEYFDILLHGKSVESEYVQLSDNREFEGFIKGNTLDFSDNVGDEVMLRDEFIPLKKKVDAAIDEYNEIVEQIKENAEVMSMVSQYAQEGNKNEYFKKAKNEINDYVKSVLELQNIKEDLDQTKMTFLDLVERIDVQEELKEKLDKKLNVISIKLTQTKSRTKGTDAETIKEIVVSTEVSGGDVVEKEVPKQEEEKAPKETKSKSGSSAFYQRMMNNLDENYREKLLYDKMIKVEEVAKAEAYWNKNKRKVIDIALEREALPSDVSHAVISLVALQKTIDAKDFYNASKIMTYTSKRATKAGQEISMLRDAFGQNSPISFMNKLLKERENLAKMGYKPMFTRTKNAVPIDQKVKEKVREAKKKAPKLSEVMQMQAQQIDDFLNDIIC